MSGMDATAPRQATDAQREVSYCDVVERLTLMLASESDPVLVMATVACELHHAFDYYDWTGFYRVVGDRSLSVGPYQGTHGCLHIPFDRGVCGAAATTMTTQLVPDVHAFEGHIACSSSTRSEIVVPVCRPTGELLAVLDVDSDDPASFNAVDQRWLELLADRLGRWMTPAAS